MPRGPNNASALPQQNEFEDLIRALSKDSGDGPEESSRGKEILDKLRNDSNLMSSLMVNEGVTSGRVSGEGTPLRGTSAQEKNRRAQKRFRERQKATINSMQDQMVSMKEEVERLEKENKDLAARNDLMDKMLRLSNDSILSMQEKHTKSNDKSYAEGAVLLDSLQVESVQEVIGDLDDSEMRFVSDGKGLISFWKKLVKDASVLLIQYDCIKDEDASKKDEIIKSIEGMLNKAGKICMQVAVYNPANFEVLMGSVLDAGTSQSPENERSHWLSVISDLMLDRNQKHQLCALYGIFKERMEKLLQACSEKVSALQQLGPDGDKKFLKDIVKRTIHVSETAKELQLRMYEEHLCRIEFWATVFKTVLTEVQKARFIVQSYPFFPDVPQVAKLISMSVDEDVPVLNNNNNHGESADGVGEMAE